MGSFSMYCGISNISITSGENCGILLVKPNTGGAGYGSHVPVTYPVWGYYDTYGRIENIERDEYTDFLEDYFGCPIESLMEYISYGMAYGSNDDKPEGLKNEDSLKDCETMWVLKDVWKFMTNHANPYLLGNFDMGNHNVLEAMGFTRAEDEDKLTEESGKRPRYYKAYSRDSFIVYSDGTWLEGGIYSPSHFSKLYDPLPVPEDIMKWARVPASMNYIMYENDPIQFREKYCWTFGIGREDIPGNYGRFGMTVEKLEELKKRSMEPKKNDGTIEDELRGGPTEAPFYDRWIRQLKERDFFMSGLGSYLIGDNLTLDGMRRTAELQAVGAAMSDYSNYYKPMRNYVTPQCGEPHSHIQILIHFIKTIVKNRHIMDDMIDDEMEYHFGNETEYYKGVIQTVMSNETIEA